MTVELPFKPFTLDEVQAVTGASAAVVGMWAQNLLTMEFGCDTYGLDYARTFAVYCGWRYLEEGAGRQRAEELVKYLASCSVKYIVDECQKGRTFPVPMRRCFVKAPDSRLGRTLNCDRLLREFGEKLKRVFPDG